MSRYLCLCLALAGAGLSALLLGAHVELGSGADEAGGMSMALCGSGGSCDKVLESRWAWFPPLPAEQNTEVAATTNGLEAKTATREIGRRVPVALLGLFYFTFMVLWFAIFGRRARVLESRLVFPLVIVGAIGSASFVALMGFTIGAFCPLCLASHVVNFLLLAGIGLRWRSLKKNAPRTAAEDVSPAGWGSKPIPLRALVLPLGLLMTMWAVEVLAYRSAKLAVANRSLSEALTAIQEDIDAMELVYFGQPKMNVVVRDDSRAGLDALEFDAAIQASDGYRNTLVVFGDVECRACQRFHDFLFESVLPAYEGHLRVVYKHLPYDAGHPSARKAALALEAARRQGKFWELLDLLYAQQGTLRNFNYSTAIVTLGLDGTQFVRDMTSPDVAARIAEDEALAGELGVTATPAVFLNSRRVDKSLVRLPGFWNSQVKRLKNSRAEAGQGWGNSTDSVEAVASSH